MKYAEFTENGWHVVADLPDKAPFEWTLTATRGDETRTWTVPMDYEPLFGPDVMDVRALEDSTDEFLREHP
jgi:hypothetical protein